MDFCGICGKKSDNMLLKSAMDINEDENESKINSVCTNCSVAVYEQVAYIIESEVQRITMDYALIDIDVLDNPPIILCSCKDKNESLLAYDFYTPENDKNRYDVILCGICRVCGGYTESRVEVNSLPFAIKDGAIFKGVTFLNEKNKKDNHNTGNNVLGMMTI